LANYIWGVNAGQTWFANLATAANEELKVVVYPNPASNYFSISGKDEVGKVELINVSGQTVLQKDFVTNVQIECNVPAGIYFVRLIMNDRVVLKKLMVK
jgi:hypothetical protein